MCFPFLVRRVLGRVSSDIVSEPSGLHTYPWLVSCPGHGTFHPHERLLPLLTACICFFLNHQSPSLDITGGTGMCGSIEGDVNATIPSSWSIGSIILQTAHGRWKLGKLPKTFGDTTALPSSKILLLSSLPSICVSEFFRGSVSLLSCCISRIGIWV